MAKCKECGGSGEEECGECGGSGMIQCYECDGTGEVNDDDNANDKESVND